MMVIIMQTRKVKRLGSGYSSIYKTPEWQTEQHNFEIRLGNYAYTHPKSHEAVNKGLSRMKYVLYEYYQDDFKDRTEFALKAFTKDDPSMAGQVGRVVGEEIFKIIGDNFTQKIDKTLSGSSSNLREKMTAFYNASGISSDASNQSINFKNIMQKIVTSNSRTSNYLINKLGLDKNSVDEAIRHNSKNIFKAGLSSGLHNLFKGPDVYGKYGMNFKSKDKDDNDLKFKYTNMDDKKKNIRNPFNNPLPLSQRELNFYNSTHFPKFEKPNMLFYTMLTMLTQKTDALEPYIDKDITEESHDIISKNGFRLTENGSSSTTTKLLNTAKWLGLKGQDLLNFRLALMGWLLPDGDHSLYEILYSSHAAGVRGDNEDLTDAASMDETIDPLITDEIRKWCGEKYERTRNINNNTINDSNYLLPIEKIFHEQNKISFNQATIDEIRDFKYSELSMGTGTNLGVDMNLAHLQAMRCYKSGWHKWLNGKLEYNRFIKNDYWFRLFLSIQTKKALTANLFRRIQQELHDNHNFPETLSSKYDKTHFAPYNMASDITQLYWNTTEIKDITNQFDSIEPNWKNVITETDRYTDDIKNKFLDKATLIIEKYVDDLTNTIIEDLGLKKNGNRSRKILNDIDITNNMLADGLRKAPKYNGKVYSGQKLLKSYRKDNIITYSMFTSTSSQKATAADYYKGAILVLKLKNTGVEIKDDLDQILIPPGSQFKVEKVTTTPENGDKVTVDESKTNGKPVTYVYLEEIKDSSYIPPKLSPTKFY